MSQDPILPNPLSILGPGIDALAAERPSALKYLSPALTGAYGNILKGSRGQIAVALEYIADYVKSGRLTTAEGDALKFLCASEFDALVHDQPVKAKGWVYIATNDATVVQGVIPKGFRFRRQASTSTLGTASSAAVIGVPEANYVAVRDTYIGPPDEGGLVQIEADREGAHANQPILNPNGLFNVVPSLVDKPFATNLQVFNFRAAGGSDGVTDDVRRRYAKAYYTGKFGPTEGSIIAGVYHDGAVKHAVFNDNPTTATFDVYLTDASWGTGETWALQTKQRLYDEEWVGFGSRIRVGVVANVVIAVTAAITVRQKSFMDSTDAITSNIQKAVRSYFDDRPDWNIWSLAGLRAAIVRADNRILACPTVAVNDRLGSPLAAPTQGTAYKYNVYSSPYDNSNLPSTTHYYLLDNGVTLTFAPPT